MTTTQKYLLQIGLLVFLSGASSPLYAGERSVEFSGFVPARSGNLSFGPLRAFAESVTARAGLQLVAANNGKTRAKLFFEAFDGHFNTTDEISLPAATILYPGETREFLAIVPIMHDVKNRYRICAVLKSSKTKQNRLCGKYIAQHR